MKGQQAQGQQGRPLTPDTGMKDDRVPGTRAPERGEGATEEMAEER